LEGDFLSAMRSLSLSLSLLPLQHSPVK